MMTQWTWTGVLAGLLTGLLASGAVMAAPDFSGVWQVEKAIPELKTVDGKTPPLKAEAAKLYAEHKKLWKAGDLSFDPTAKCISPGLPRMLYLPYPFEIIQSPNKLVYLFEWNYWNRRVYLTDKVKEVPYAISLGLSQGKWQGDTLVVKTTDLRADNTLLDSAGMPRSESMKITEKLHLVDPMTLEARFTIDDPETFTKPWDTVVRFKKLPVGTEIKEDICLDRTDAGKPAVDWKRVK
jgi:hypothetical protein